MDVSIESYSNNGRRERAKTSCHSNEHLRSQGCRLNDCLHNARSTDDTVEVAEDAGSGEDQASRKLERERGSLAILRYAVC